MYSLGLGYKYLPHHARDLEHPPALLLPGSKIAEASSTISDLPGARAISAAMSSSLNFLIVALCVHVYIYIFMYVCMYVCMYVYIYIW